MAAIAGIPGLIALIVSLRRGPAFALIDVYLPTLLLLPDYFRWILPGLPDPTFNEAAIVPIVGIFVMRGVGRWRFSITDLLIVGLGLEMPQCRLQRRAKPDVRLRSQYHRALPAGQGLG
jgi:hypothetical protein